MDLWHTLQSMADHPTVRLATLVISLASMMVAYLSFRRTTAAVENYWKNVSAEQSRFIEEQWSKTYRLTLESPQFAKHAAETFGLAGVDEAQRDAAILLYLNICAMAFHGYRSGVISRTAYGDHMTSFFAHYKGDTGVLERLITLAGLPEDFKADCRSHLAKRITNPVSLSKSE